MFIWPTTVTRITSKFRPSHRPNHNGIDIADGTAPYEIFAIADGTVSRSYTSSSYGECIMIVHNINGQTWESVYAHMRTGTRRVKAGQKVKQGQVIGIMGNTGRSSGQHLHFELHRGRWNDKKTNAVDPLKYISPTAQKGKKTTTKSYLSLGDKGQAVKKLQQDLIKAGEKLPKYGADGHFGKETDSAVRSFQRKHGLKVDGKAGTQTQKKLDEVLSRSLPDGVLRRGSRGENVKKVQMALNSLNFKVGKVDGIYGAKTEDAVRRFQKVHLPYDVDGIYGPKTRAKMLEIMRK